MKIPPTLIGKIFFSIFHPVLATKGELLDFASSNGSIQRYVATRVDQAATDLFATQRSLSIDPDQDIRAEVRRRIASLQNKTDFSEAGLAAVANKVDTIFSGILGGPLARTPSEIHGWKNATHHSTESGPDFLLGSRSITLLTGVELGHGGSKIIEKGIKISLFDQAGHFPETVAINRPISSKRTEEEGHAEKLARQRDEIRKEAAIVARIVNARNNPEYTSQFISGLVTACTDSTFDADARHFFHPIRGAASHPEPPLYQVVDLAVGDLTKLPQLSFQQRFTVLMEATHGLQLTHEAGVVHRDVKPNNIFVYQAKQGSGELQGRLGDFGIATTGTPTYFAGTPAYLAPEEEQTQAADIWALGLTLMETLFKIFPVNYIMHAHGITSRDSLINSYDLNPNNRDSGNDEFKAMPLKRQLLIRWLHRHSCTYPDETLEPRDKILPSVQTPMQKNLTDLIEEMLSLDPENRPTAEAVYNRLIKEILPLLIRQKEKLIQHQSKVEEARVRARGDVSTSTGRSETQTIVVEYTMEEFRETIANAGVLYFPAGARLKILQEDASPLWETYEFKTHVSKELNKTNTPPCSLTYTYSIADNGEFCICLPPS